MAFTGNAFCTSAKVGFLSGTYALTDTMRIALYTNLATLDASTTAYSVLATGEVVGTGYSPGGINLAGFAVGSSGTTAWITFDNAVWLAASFTARGALIYDHTASDAAIAVLDFGADKTVSGTTFIVQMPVASATTALIRIA